MLNAISLNIANPVGFITSYQIVNGSVYYDIDDNDGRLLLMLLFENLSMLMMSMMSIIYRLFYLSMQYVWKLHSHTLPQKMILNISDVLEYITVADANKISMPTAYQCWSDSRKYNHHTHTHTFLMERKKEKKNHSSTRYAEFVAM